MNEEETIRYLKEIWARKYPYATLTVTHRTVKGKKRLYFKTKGAYKIESGRLIESLFPTVYRYKDDYINLTYHYKTD